MSFKNYFAVKTCFDGKFDKYFILCQDERAENGKDGKELGEHLKMENTPNTEHKRQLSKRMKI